jgi:dual specificity phosphatase 12
MWARRIGATEAQDIVRRGNNSGYFYMSDFQRFPAREQVWFNPGFQEQLVLWEVCQYAPSPKEGVYQKWRMKIEHSLAQGAGNQ